MDIIALTICVNYSDILKHLLEQNAKLLKTWYIVTSPDDKETVKLIHESKLPNVRVLFYTKFYLNAKFNKGGAVRFAQEFINGCYSNANVLILDADILLPSNFKEVLPAVLANNTLYGVTRRTDYWTLHDFINKTSPHKYAPGDTFPGFFQLYKQNPKYLYKNSNNCAKCDDEFRELFANNKINLDISVDHLGQEGVNWNGRVGVI